MSSIDAAQFLATTPVSRIPKLSPVVLKKMARLDIKTIGDIQNTPANELYRQFREVAHLLERISQGEDHEQVRPLWPPRSVIRNVTFEDEVTDLLRVEQAMQVLTEQISAALHEQNVYCKIIELTLTFGGKQPETAKDSCKHPVRDVKEILDSVRRLYSRLTKNTAWVNPIIALSISASSLGFASGIQLELLDQNDCGQGLPHERSTRLENTANLINSRFGRSAISYLKFLQGGYKINLWRSPLTHQRHEPIQVELDCNGLPSKCWRMLGRQEVELNFTGVLDSWTESGWFDSQSNQVYRMISTDGGLYELHECKSQWQIGAVWD